MLTYYRMFLDPSPDSWVLNHLKDTNGAYYPSGVFAMAKPFPLDKNVVTNILHNGIYVDFHDTAGIGPIVSEKLASLIIDIDGSAIQRIPLTIETIVSSQYEILNIIHTVEDCINYDMSGEISYFSDDFIQVEKRGKIMSILDLKIKSENIPANFHIFRLSEWLIPIIVSDKIKNSIEAKNLTGMTFIPV